MSAAEKLAPLEACGVAEEIRTIAANAGATVDEVLGPSRVGHVVRARRAAMRLVRERLAWSYPAIGRLFGRQHMAVLAACRDETRAAKVRLQQKLRTYRWAEKRGAERR